MVDLLLDLQRLASSTPLVEIRPRVFGGGALPLRAK
jgi:hypothetical protein